MLFKSSSILLTAQASHFRAGSFQFSQSDTANELVLTRTLNYRAGFSGYGSGCTQADVDSETLSGKMESEYAYLLSDGSSAGGLDTNYVVTNFDTTGPTNSQWCYGSVDNTFTKPSGGFSYYFTNCCSVDLTDDDGTTYSSGDYKLYAEFSDLNNNSPQVKLPPLWLIMSGCPAQTIDLTPTDKDGDVIRCRWSTEFEARDSYHGSGNYGSLTLDEENCIVTYDGTLDTITGGVKPIAVQVEDYDANGNVRSSMPVQFLATVWTPELDADGLRSSARPRSGEISWLWGDAFTGDDEHEHAHGRKRRSALINPNTGLPYYCEAPPTLVSPSPAAGSEIEVSGNVQIVVAAESNYDIDSFQFNSPAGMICGSVDTQTGQVICNWTPSAEQRDMGVHSFCFMANDSLGRSSERRCVSLKIVDRVEDIVTMLNTYAPQYGYRELFNYGCAGRAMLDPFYASIGLHVNAQDGFLHTWKQCIRCAKDAPLTKIDQSVADREVPKYTFNTTTELCGKISKVHFSYKHYLRKRGRHCRARCLRVRQDAHLPVEAASDANCLSAVPGE